MFSKMNYYGMNKIPFLFVIDFDVKNIIVLRPDEAAEQDIFLTVSGQTNAGSPKDLKKSVELYRDPVLYKRYTRAFDFIMQNLNAGNSYLDNLTFPTAIKINLTLKEIFYSNNAASKIINDEKEFAEHITAVDFLRNDLGMISKNVEVARFRYIDEIQTHDKKLLQVSSEIRGDLEDGYNGKIGEIIRAMLPAGSVTGAPKKKTVQLIKKAEYREMIDKVYVTVY